ncbi:septal ring lytic transglycosylase RlpA family protein [Fusobacterium sp. PH5-44]|uniref:septal ring lytic transglycosylase RlpA family protein n=1 Tax=unclassified Fusobacterium TaxID=2648384 RepID=UPI003D201D56
MLKNLLIIIILMSHLTFAKVASWYGKGFEGKKTASGYRYNSSALTCASNRYPFGTVLKVTNKSNKKSVVVVVTDRGGFGKYKREIDLSKAAFNKIANINQGLIKVKIDVLSKEKTFKSIANSPNFTNKEYEKFVSAKHLKK